MRRWIALALSLVPCFLPFSAQANSDPYSGIAAPGSLAIGAAQRVERSPYGGAGVRHDFLPLYLYEGRSVYLRSHSVGLKFGSDEQRFELLLRHRFEGHPVDEIPAALAGMARREPGVDFGAAVRLAYGPGIVYAEWLHDVSSASRGGELRLGYLYPWRSGRLWLRPHAAVALRDSRLNNYYYGVRSEEATPTREAYQAGSGLVPEIGVHAAYTLTERWHLTAAAAVARLPSAVRASPIVEHASVYSLSFGAIYDLSQEHEAWPERKPLIVRLLYGASSGCDVLPIVTLRCTSVHTQDKTGIAGAEVGRPFIDRLNGWPLDLAAFIGLIRHQERGVQPDFWQINAYIKAYFYGFPWDARLRSRLGLGVGLSYANRIPFVEQRDQAERGRNTSKLLNTFDPTVDFSLGDLLGSRRLRETYVGMGVSHRSGIFGTAQVLNNVKGGSNYIYGFVEKNF